jgi:hypothetical protein
MRWQFDRYKSSFKDFHGLIAITISAFPHLKALHLSLEGDLKLFTGGNSAFERSDADILTPIDAMARRFHSVESCHVELPLTLYRAWWRKIKTMHSESLKIHDIYERIWREFPDPIAENEQHADKHLPGYWVCVAISNLISVGC